ncbi:MAG: DEAD/DEAH box helicase [Alphaproteobacteria bacterium]|nr:DEAD/DEAH box helicase [Alphaproteobacteria bacterium]
MATLLERYEGLSFLERRILQVSSLILPVRSKGFFVEILSKTVRGEDGKIVNESTFNSILKKLKGEGFLGETYNCNPKIVHAIVGKALNPENEKLIQETLGNNRSYSSAYGSYVSNSKLVYFAIHQNNASFFLTQEVEDSSSYLIYRSMDIFYEGIFEEDWIKTRAPIIQLFLCVSKLSCFYTHVLVLPPDLEVWAKFYKETFLLEKKETLSLSIYMQRCCLQIDVAMGVFHPSFKERFIEEEQRGGLLFFQGNMKPAVRAYDASRLTFKRDFDLAEEWAKDNNHAVFYFLSLLYLESYTKALHLIKQVRRVEQHPLLGHLLETFFHLKQGNIKQAKENLARGERDFKGRPSAMLLSLSLFDLTRSLMGNKVPLLNEKFLNSINLNSLLSAHVYAELLLRETPEKEDAHHFLEKSPFKEFRFLSLTVTKEMWEYEIGQLEAILGLKKEDNAERRLVWLLNPTLLSLEVLEQKRTKGGWTEGKAIALKRLYELDPSLNYLTEQDKGALKGLKPDGWYRDRFVWDMSIVLKKLIDHPHVFEMGNKEVPLELVLGELELNVEKVESNYVLSLSHHESHPRVFLEKESPNRYRVIEYPEEGVRISSIIPKNGLTLPFEAKERLLGLIVHTKGSIKINSSVDEDIPEAEGDTTCSVHLVPIEEGLRASLWVRPFKNQGPYLQPGIGKESLIGNVELEGKEFRQKVLRDLKNEKRRKDHLIENVPSFLEQRDSHDFYFETLESSLELLSELELYRSQHPLHIEWPKGESLKVKGTLSFGNMSLNIRGEGHWFEYDGEVTIDEQQALHMKELLDLLETASGRFIRMKDGEFLALKEDFRKQLENLKALSEGNKVYHLSSKSLRDLAEKAGETKSSQEWEDHLKRLRAMERHNPQVPSTLEASLRDYQEEGFKYLSRLSNWGIGACLADDMGLGKTIQATALLLEHSSKGSSLVVVPTSLSFTWRDELLKFAPTLNPILFQESSDRKKTIEEATKRDVLICSYGLLHQEGELLQKKTWQVVILDEAQSIKNKDTKRWQYATALKSKSRIALTGTPIENHLGELWSLFHFLNPGLLGSFSSFQSKLWTPIEKLKDPMAKRTLKALVSPYILRRTKSEVLLELPSKTEQTLFIEPSKEEEAFYEALRLKALERIKNIAEGNQKRFSVLAEITRLRQACCHTSLVDDTFHLESSKIKAFLEIVKNLKENNHRALVFSQYVGYLKKIRDVLEEEDISYQYLDGTTPLKERQQQIEKFQEGEGDLFLISLKAGGTGLNLTAADYVIILDPWWNPAVEDQAASRAHRMGQERPVTVYRLIMKNTIEEKIINLHKDKRDLADDLLNETGRSGKLTEEELLKLMT